MFDSLPVLPPDSILGLAAACRADPNPDKVDLTLGVYMDETGLCPVFEAVQQRNRPWSVRNRPRCICRLREIPII
jgi:aspartate aminotransferase